MKIITKIVTCLFALTLLLTFTACGDKVKVIDETPVSAIEIGGDYEAIDLNTTALGEYVQVEIPSWYVHMEGNTDTIYYSAQSDTPFISVVTHAKDGMTLEEYTAAEANTWGDGYYQLLEGNVCYYTGAVADKESGAVMYYSENIVYELEDCFKTVGFFAKTEEVQISDSDLYFYIPTGYTDTIETADTAFIGSIRAEYDDSYYFPNLYACRNPQSYAENKAYF